MRILKDRDLHQQAFRFVVVGAAAALISYIVFILLYNSVLPDNIEKAATAQPISYIAGMGWSFYWHRRWTFGSRGHVGGEMFWFLVMNGASLVISTVGIHLLVDLAGLNAHLGWFLVTAVTTIFNFTFGRFVVFRTRTEQ
ncbi:GtrA family protein [Oceanibacterium hippocampi]|uniref:GtrA-like protein n=1 Tax=Oceanibacterium hippocampi TaxID=745714 RepID=A0A1Y5TQJ3_9PROT|nr:GtrA family protein [Oceanibacterium hippocampi]SLN69182.1 GtrA-like protein [Oceanibacterium hippocampi]